MDVDNGRDGFIHIQRQPEVQIALVVVGDRIGNIREDLIVDQNPGQQVIYWIDFGIIQADL